MTNIHSLITNLQKIYRNQNSNWFPIALTGNPPILKEYKITHLLRSFMLKAIHTHAQSLACIPLNFNSLHSCRVAREYGSPRSVRCLWLSAYKMSDAVLLWRTANTYSSISFRRILRVFLLLPRHMPVSKHKRSLVCFKSVFDERMHL